MIFFDDKTPHIRVSPLLGGLTCISHAFAPPRLLSSKTDIGDTWAGHKNYLYLLPYEVIFPSESPQETHRSASRPEQALGE